MSYRIKVTKLGDYAYQFIVYDPEGVRITSGAATTEIQARQWAEHEATQHRLRSNAPVTVADYEYEPKVDA